MSESTTNPTPAPRTEELRQRTDAINSSDAVEICLTEHASLEAALATAQAEQNELFDALKSECESSKSLRAEVAELRREVERLTAKTIHMFRLIHDRFHECGDFRNPNAPQLTGD